MLVTCQYCKVKDTDKKDIFDSGHKYKKYYHHECWVKFEKEEAFRVQERKEQDELSDTIKRIHGVQIVPQFVWQNLNDLRFGNAVIKDKYGKKKRQKKGVSYSVINDAYLRQEKWINKARHEKSFDSTTQEMMYCMKIMMNSINDVVREQIRKKKQEESMQMVVNELPSEIVDKPKFKKTVNKNDISEFLDD